MKHSPFAFFRKYQRVGMVALTVMAMFSFVFMDAFTNRGGGGNARGGQVAVKIAGGNLTDAALSELRAKRGAINEFIERIIRTAYSADEKDKPAEQELRGLVQNSLFGIEWYPGYGELNTDQVVIWGHIMRLEANRLGLVVTDPMVTSYITRMTNNKLTPEQFRDALASINVREKQLYDMFRDELLARNAWSITRPLIDQTPEQYWDYYRRMNVRQNLEVAALPVSEFAKEIKDPGDSVLIPFFEAHKLRFQGQGLDSWVPGFRQPDKVRVQYLSASYDDVEKTIPPVGDKDIVEFYEKNKDTLYRELEKPEAAGTGDAAPLNPELAPESPAAPALPESDKPNADAPAKDAADKPAEKPAEAKPAEEKPAADKPAAEEKPAEEKKAEPEAPKAEEKPAEEKKAEKSCEDQPAPAKEAAAEEKPATEKAAEEKPAETKPEDAKPAEAKPAEAKPAEEKPVAEKAAEEKPAAGDKPATDKPAADAPVLEKAPVKYQPLTPELKENIGEELLRQRTQEALKKRCVDAIQELEDRKLRFNMPVAVAGNKAYVDFDEDGELDADEPWVESKTKLDPEAIDKIDAKITTELKLKVISIAGNDLKALGKKLGMKFSETGLLSAREIDTTPGLGKVIDEGDNPFQPSGSGRILNVLFGKEQLFNAEMGKDSETQDAYVYWKAEQVKSHVPKFTDDGIKDAVLAAWKLQEAYPIAVKRAEELAKLAGSQTKLEVALKDQTVTSGKDALPVLVHETADFSWMTPGTPTPNSMLSAPMPSLSTVAFVEDAGEQFMQVACNELAVGQSGVAPNQNRSIVYVIRVIHREPKPGEETDRLRETFMKERLFGIVQFNIPSVYTHIANQDRGKLDFEWMESLKQKYHVTFVDEEKMF